LRFAFDVEELSKLVPARNAKVTGRQAVRFLEQNGFVLDHTSGSYFVYYHPTSHRRAVVARHNRDLPKRTLMSLLREAGFTREQLLDFLVGSG
jgi:predicted RNA binding protein YcfA (HicA-like mRNA interferase family)